MLFHLWLNFPSFLDSSFAYTLFTFHTYSDIWILIQLRGVFAVYTPIWEQSIVCAIHGGIQPGCEIPEERIRIGTESRYTDINYCTSTFAQPMLKLQSAVLTILQIWSEYLDLYSLLITACSWRLSLTLYVKSFYGSWRGGLYQQLMSSERVQIVKKTSWVILKYLPR